MFARHSQFTLAVSNSLNADHDSEIIQSNSVDATHETIWSRFSLVCYSARSIFRWTSDEINKLINSIRLHVCMAQSFHIQSQ